MKAITLLALVAAATVGYAAEAGQQGEEHYAKPSYDQEDDGGDGYDPDSTPSYAAPPSYGGGGSHHGSWGGGGGWSGHRKGRFGGKKWGYDDDDDEDDDDDDDDDDDYDCDECDGGGKKKWYGICDECIDPPDGYARPPRHIRWPTDPDDFPPGPFRKHFKKIGDTCSSKATAESGSYAAGCCNKKGTEDGSDSGGGGLLGGLLNGLLGGGPTCTLDVLSSLCSPHSGSVACCPTKDSGNGFSLINVQSVCVPVTL